MKAPLDGRVVLLGLVACVGVTVLTPPGHWARLGGEAVLVAAALAVAPARAGRERSRAGWLLRRFALLLPFLLMLGGSIPFMAAVPGQPPPLARAGLAAARAVIGFGALAAALQYSDVPELLQSLARLRVPAIFLTLTALMLRYLDLLEGEAARMMRARELRGTPPALRQRARVAGCMVGSLFLRSFERAERVSVAMQSRGFNGPLPSPSPRPLGARGAAAGALLLLGQALLVWAT